MVFFTCNNCGECLKKNAVQNHNFRCRTSQGVSCMDCHKVFGEDFVNHLSCVTEQEKYGGSGFVGKEAKNQKKQEQWVEKVLEAWKNDASTKLHFDRYFQDSNKTI
ncbi:Cell growth-regulating nucleolar protein [Armadillidium nasatum]|uniref:Cell growth-regulating nucleolar protein n=1 Tax=Armadillidium nasatum TaxID=96803 RepID=A0A5N5STH0_9CRUS|nr:Cell growth-regulating nucleolar protein [Armadillidium nasatum]